MAVLRNFLGLFEQYEKFKTSKQNRNRSREIERKTFCIESSKSSSQVSNHCSNILLLLKCKWNKTLWFRRKALSHHNGHKPLTTVTLHPHETPFENCLEIKTKSFPAVFCVLSQISFLMIFSFARFPF